MGKIYSDIIGTGSYVPERILTNADLERILKEKWPNGPEDRWTSNEWIIQRTGIATRHIAEENETNATMGAMAARHAIVDAGIQVKDLDFIVCATNTNAVNFPSCAAEIQDRLGANKAKGNHNDVPVYDVQAGCTAFNYALENADFKIRSGEYNCGLVIGADKLSAVTDYTDRSTCVLFGDLASAFVLRRATMPGIIKHVLYADGSKRNRLVMNSKRFMEMDGREIFRFATEKIVELCREILEGTGYKLSDVKVVPHQANSRITKASEERLGVKFYKNIDKYGNTSAASYPHAFHEALKSGWLTEGDLVILVGFGAGLTWGANLLRVGEIGSRQGKGMVDGT